MGLLLRRESEQNEERDHVIFDLENESPLFDNLSSQTDFCTHHYFSVAKSAWVGIISSQNE